MSLIKLFSFNSFVLLILFAFSACTTTTEIEFEQEVPKLVVNSIVAPEKAFWVTIYNSIGPLEAESNYREIENAQVRIFEEGELLEELIFEKNFDTESVARDGGSFLWRSFDEDKQGLYYSTEHLAKAGKTYTIEVEAPGFEKVTAQSHIPNTVPSFELELDTNNIRVDPRNPSQLFVDAILRIDDPIGEENFYHFYSIESERVVIAGDTIFYQNSVYLNSNNLSVLEINGLNGYVFPDALFDGQQNEIRFSLPFYESLENPQIQTLERYWTFELRHVNESYYNFAASFSTIYTDNEQPLEGFSELFQEPESVYNNIENGYGLFAGFNRARENFPVPK